MNHPASMMWIISFHPNARCVSRISSSSRLGGYNESPPANESMNGVPPRSNGFHIGNTPFLSKSAKNSRAMYPRLRVSDPYNMSFENTKSLKSSVANTTSVETTAQSGIFQSEVDSLLDLVEVFFSNVPSLLMLIPTINNRLICIEMVIYQMLVAPLFYHSLPCLGAQFVKIIPAYK